MGHPSMDNMFNRLHMFLLKKYFITSLLAILPFAAISQANLALIPKPSALQVHEGTFHFPAETKVYASPAFKGILPLLQEYPGITTVPQKKAKGSTLMLERVESDSLHESAYTLQIRKDRITLKAASQEGMIAAVLTLVQLGHLQPNPQELPLLDIYDSPRFGYRGLHLDVSRHFMPLSFVKKYIDLMALYKFNAFHWHLTDGAGWRLEIKQFPELTEKAAWRTHTLWKDWWQNGRRYVDRGTPNASGGFYTQAEVREVVAYAAQRGITVIPEIEMPGHSEEVLAVYPHLSCSGNPYEQSEFCIGNPETFVFLKAVLDEVLELFPSPYIHIGGDEADKRHWAKCPKDQALMKEKGLATVDELQSYAIRQMDEYLQSKGRKLIGWDEILEGGLSAGATVMSWRGESGGISAANSGHDVIMTPGSHLYFDAYQTDPRTQPEAMAGYLPLEKVYSYDPIPEAIAADKRHHILGAQANIWTEYVPHPQHVEYMVFPRALALAEVNWTAPQNKSWKDFQNRLQAHYKILQDLHVNYYRPSYNVTYEVKYDSITRTNLVTLNSEQLNLQNIRYTTDGSVPLSTSARYEKPFVLEESKRIHAQYFMDELGIGPVLTFQTDLHKAIGKPVRYNNPWDSYAAQGTTTLTNGLQGGLTYHDGQWQGFTKDIKVVVDLLEDQEFVSVSMNFMQLIGPGVYMPGLFKVEISTDGEDFEELGSMKNDVSDQDPKLTFKRFTVSTNQTRTARFIRISATNPKGGYLFADEIIVY